MEDFEYLIKQEDYEKYKKLLQEFECKAIDIIEELTRQFKETLAEEIDDKIKGWKKDNERILRENWEKDDKIKQLEAKLAELKEKYNKASEKLKNITEEVENNFVHGQDYEKLKQELAELKEKAIVPPVKIGDTIYVVPSKTNYEINIINRHSELNKVYEYIVSEIRYNKYGYSVVCELDNIPFYFNYEKAKKWCCEHFDTEKFYRETWFTTEQEAQDKLKEIQGNE